MFEGGFLCLDNIGPIDRSAMLPVAARLEQSDRIASMAMYSLNLLEPHEGTHPNHVSGSVKGHGLG